MSASVMLKRFREAGFIGVLKEMPGFPMTGTAYQVNQNSAGQTVSVNDLTVKIVGIYYQMPKMSTLWDSGLSQTEVSLCKAS